MERSKAKEKGLPTYSTGRPCRNGHSSHRYTSSGSCATCIRESNRGVRREPLPAPLLTHHTPGDLMECWLMARDRDIGDIERVVWACTQLRFPTMPTTWYAKRGQRVHVAGNISKYRFKIHPDDWDTMYAYTNKRSSDPHMDQHIAATRARLASMVPQGDALPPPVELRGIK